MTVILDSWAVLRLLEGTEPAASRVQEAIDEQRPVMSWINAGEVFYITRRAQGEQTAREVLRDLRAALDLDMASADRVVQAARIKADHPLAYADAFAAATAIAHDATLWTGDPELLIPNVAWRHEDLRH